MTANRSPVDVQDLLADPARFGFPTYAQFAENPDKYRYTLNERLGKIDQSNVSFKNLVQKHHYRLGRHSADTLEAIEHIAKEEGIDLMRCKLAPVVERHAGGKCDIEIEFVPDTGVLDSAGAPVLKFFKRIFKGKDNGKTPDTTSDSNT